MVVLMRALQRQFIPEDPEYRKYRGQCDDGIPAAASYPVFTSNGEKDMDQGVWVEKGDGLCWRRCSKTGIA